MLFERMVAQRSAVASCRKTTRWPGLGISSVYTAEVVLSPAGDIVPGDVTASDPASRKVDTEGQDRRERRRSAPPRRRRALAVLGSLAIGGLLVASPLGDALFGHSAAATGVGISASSRLRQRIVAIADSQIGYRTSPADTYCNKYSAYFHAGIGDCGNANLDEEWCVDFAAWVWERAGALVVYQYLDGDINGSAASVVAWGVAHHTWHPLGDGYAPEPGDIAVYARGGVVEHVAIVTSALPGDRGPDVVNGDDDLGAFSDVEPGSDQYEVNTGTTVATLAGYVAPTPDPSDSSAS